MFEIRMYNLLWVECQYKVTKDILVYIFNKKKHFFMLSFKTVDKQGSRKILDNANQVGHFNANKAELDVNI